jgi:SOS-response transcriptional repressor LexA
MSQSIDEIRLRNVAKLVQTHFNNNQSTFAEAIGRGPSQINQWFNNRRAIGEKSARWIEQKLGLIHLILDSQDEIEAVETPHFGSVPLLSLISAGALGKEHPPLSGEQRVPLRHVKQSASLFGLRITGDSMTDMLGKGFPEGSEVVFDTQRSPKVGDYVVAMDNTTHTATFKQLMSDGARWWLKPLNPQHSIIPIEHPDLAVTAVAVEWHMGGAL